MADTSILRIAGIGALLSLACIVATIAIGISSGSGGPVALDFGDPASLERMRAGGAIPPLLSLLALIGPSLGLLMGVGWWKLLGHRGGYVLAGVVLWYLGMVFVIWQDALEYVLVANLPEDYAASSGARAEALLATGALLGKSIEVFTLVGDTINFAGLLLVDWALWRSGGKWRILAVIGALSSVLIAIGLYVPSLAIVRLPGFMLFTAWFASMGIAMLRGRAA